MSIAHCFLVEIMIPLTTELEIMSNGDKEKIVMSIGGTLVVPNGGIDINFLTNLNKFIRSELAKNKNRQFFLTVGGGAIARHYRDAGKDVLGSDLDPDDLDRLGIHATRLNAHLIRTIFRDIAHPYIIKHYEIIRKVVEPVIVAAGGKPGWSTDYDAVLLCEDYGVKELINLSNISQVFTKDPKKFADAKPLEKISWADLRKIIGDKWIPGLNCPFDPVAAKKAEGLGIRAIIMNGYDLNNAKKYLEGKKFIGTVVE